MIYSGNRVMLNSLLSFLSLNISQLASPIHVQVDTGWSE